MLYFYDWHISPSNAQAQKSKNHPDDGGNEVSYTPHDNASHSSQLPRDRLVHHRHRGSGRPHAQDDEGGGHLLQRERPQVDALQRGGGVEQVLAHRGPTALEPERVVQAGLGQDLKTREELG